jgi:hypothetical protein
MIVVVVLVGAVAYVALGSSSGGTTTSICEPKSSAACGNILGTHDLRILAAYKSMQTGQPDPLTALLPSGESASSFSFNFGDGTAVTPQTTPTVSHAYSNPGTYIIQLTAVVNGVTHDNLRALSVVTVSASYSVTSAGESPAVGGAVLENATSNTTPSAVLLPAQSVTLQGSYLGAPTNPDFIPASPTLTVSPTTGVTNGTPSGTPTSISNKFTFNSPGTFVATMVAKATGSGPYAGQTAYQNYTWTVLVAPTGVHAGVAGAAAATDPHPGTVIYYSTAVGGATSLDPAIAYDTVSYEPILSVYEGLIMYNGSATGTDPSDYLPVLSTCVPGPNSASCTKLYGSDLYSGDNYTFPIDKNARFYDPNGGSSTGWPVYPSDVVFSLARTMAFADLPASGAHNGWILAQSLLPGPSSTTNAANHAWDSGIHFPYNNTPQNIFNAMTVNGSACTSTIMAGSNGCVTLTVNGNGENWPFFLELIADQLGSSIMPCGWVSATDSHGGDAGIPYWTAGNVSGSGDHPCPLPGAVSGYGVAPSAMPVNGWDSYEEAGSGASNQGGSIGTPVSAMVGSGAFYLANYQVGASYTLQASPAYASNPQCTWTNCMPLAGHTAKKVEVTWETDISQGEQALSAGVADTAGIPSTDNALLLQLIQQGKVNVLSVPTLSIYFYPFNFLFDVAGAQKYTTSSISVPADWFTYLGMRQFFATSYPYQLTIKTVYTQDGIPSGFDYGGAIPQFMANYYASNVSWPDQDPGAACAGSGASSPACPSYWWTQMTTPGSPYYDPEAAQCTPSSPCQLPLLGQTGYPPGDEAVSLWVNDVSQFSGGAVKVGFTDLNFGTLVVNSLFSSPGQNPMPVYTLGWAPDYPDPTDYVAPLYYPDSTYTFSDTVNEQMNLLASNATGCSTNFYYYAALTAPVNQSCQGAAYDAMSNALLKAATLPPGPARVLLYNQAEHIANQLALYVYSYQSYVDPTMASWVNLSSLNTNVTIGGGGDFVWWALSGNGVWG